jgi:aromatic ring hydroxylase
MKQALVGVEAITTLNELVMAYLDEFNMRPKPKEVGIPQTRAEKAAENLIKASYAEETDYQSVMSTINRTVGVMRDIEQDLISHDLSKYIDRRKKVEQLGSIMHISRAYPDNALKRLKSIRPQKVIDAAA